MENEFVPYQESLELKELGFNERCFTYYEINRILSTTPKESGDDIKYTGDYKFDRHQNHWLNEDESCSAPLYQQAFRWFREKYNIHSCIDTFNGFIFINGKAYVNPQNGVNSFPLDVLDVKCINILIEIVKNK